jgi:ribose transport system substrate-binding protein
MIHGLLAALVLASSAAGPVGTPARPVQDAAAAQQARLAERAKSPRSPAHVAFVSNGVADFWTIAKAGALAAGKQLGCKVTVEFPGAGLSDQKRMLEDLVTRGIDGISVSPIDPANQGEVLSLVAERSFLITNDSDAPKSPRLCYVGMDN